jgi:hypothetical protein
MLVFMLGLIVVAALLIVVVIDASTLFIARLRLDSAADGAALAGAQTVDLATLYTGAGSGSLPVDRGRVADAVRNYLVLDGDTQVDVVTVSTDGTVVRVELAQRVRLPFVDLVTPGATDGVVVHTSAAATSPFLP